MEPSPTGAWPNQTHHQAEAGGQKPRHQQHHRTGDKLFLPPLAATTAAFFFTVLDVPSGFTALFSLLSFFP
jgi:hypothetical protein